MALHSNAALAVLFLSVLSASGSRTSLAQDVPFAQAGVPVPAGGQLSDLMVSALQRHAVLWAAGNAGNWPLAAYEIQQLRNRFVEAASVYRALPVDVVVAMTKALDEVQRAVDVRDKARFQNSYMVATDACNACHAAADIPFIRIRRPSAPAFPNLDIPLRSSDRAVR